MPTGEPARASAAPKKPCPPERYRVGLLTGCVQDLIYSDVNRDTADVLLANGCTVVTPPAQGCCGSLHAHNGEYEMAKGYARRLIDHFDLDSLDAIITTRPVAVRTSSILTGSSRTTRSTRRKL